MLSRLRFFVPFVGALICLTFVGVLFASAADLPAGTRPATAADLPLMRIAGIPNPQIGMPWNADDPNTGRGAAEAKQWLAQHATKSSNVSCMNAEFAQKLKRFMEAVPGGPPVITSGYRSIAEQNAIIARGDGATRVKSACDSYHPWGLAADFNNNSGATTAWMRANASAHGIATIGAWDLNHFQSGQGKGGECGKCAGDPIGNGVLADTAGSGPKSLSDQIRQALGQQPLPPPPPPPPPPPQSQPVPPPTKQQTPLSDFFGIPTSTSAVSTNINVNTNTNATSTKSTSTIDLINEFLDDPVSGSIDIGKAVDIDLNPDTSDTASLNGKKPTSTLSTIGTLAINQTLSVPQTFTSSDLANSPFSIYMGGQNTFVWKILETMKNTLLLALSYLRPFGGIAPAQHGAE